MVILWVDSCAIELVVLEILISLILLVPRDVEETGRIHENCLVQDVMRDQLLPGKKWFIESLQRL